MSTVPPSLDARLVETIPIADMGAFPATVPAGVRGLYNTFQFVLRLSQPVHERLAKLPNGIATSSQVGFDDLEAFSTYLHETIHWWQHVGSTYGLILSMTYPAEAHANYDILKRLSAQIGFKKSIRKLTEMLQGPSTPDTPLGLANVVVNNQFDFDAFRRITFSPQAREAVANDPLFESMGHALRVTYGNVVHLLSVVADPAYEVLPNPESWRDAVAALGATKEEGYYYGSPLKVYPLGSRQIMEGQARFAQIQYLHFASGKRLDWDAFHSIGMPGGAVYRDAFDLFLRQANLEWPKRIDDPVVALFLLICDMAINPGAGFPFSVRHPKSFIEDADPGTRFMFLASAVRMFCPEVSGAIKNYSRAEYEEVSEKLAAALKIDSPLSIARTVASWPSSCRGFSALSFERETFDFNPVNLPIRVMLSHFVALMADKNERPEFFCWPGAWMAGERVSENEALLFDKHSVLFVDRSGDSGVFPRLQAGKDQALVQSTFQSFFGSVATYDLTRQWIIEPGPFQFPFGWLVERAKEDEMKEFGGGAFEHIYGVSIDSFEIL